jgi:hypothetical protein
MLLPMSEIEHAPDDEGWCFAPGEELQVPYAQQPI